MPNSRAAQVGQSKTNCPGCEKKPKSKTKFTARGQFPCAQGYRAGRRNEIDSMAGLPFETGCLAPADPIGCELITGEYGQLRGTNNDDKTNQTREEVDGTLGIEAMDPSAQIFE